MIEAQETSIKFFLHPISLGTGVTATSLVVDTDGFNYVSLYADVGVVGATGITVLKWQESHNADGSGAVDITGATNAAFTTAATTRGGFLSLGTGRRYLTVVMTNGATGVTLATAFAILSRSNEMPSTAAQRGLAAQFVLP